MGKILQINSIYSVNIHAWSRIPDSRIPDAAGTGLIGGCQPEPAPPHPGAGGSSVPGTRYKNKFFKQNILHKSQIYRGDDKWVVI